MRAYLFPFLLVKTYAYYPSLMYMKACVFFLSNFMSMHDSCQRTHASTCRDHSYTLESCGGDKCDADSLSLVYKHTYKHTYNCVYTFIHICFLFVVWVCTTACCLTLCFSWIQGNWFSDQPVVGPATRHFRRAFIAWVSLCVSRGCLESTVLEWKCWMCVSVCT
jgi:hypothetical protein